MSRQVKTCILTEFHSMYHQKHAQLWRTVLGKSAKIHVFSQIVPQHKSLNFFKNIGLALNFFWLFLGIKAWIDTLNFFFFRKWSPAIFCLFKWKSKNQLILPYEWVLPPVMLAKNRLFRFVFLKYTIFPKTMISLQKMAYKRR